jgi:hypothetical protein
VWFTLLAVVASAQRESVSVANDEARDDVRGVLLRVEVDEAGALARRGLRLEPGAHQVFLVLTDTTGRTLFDGSTVRAAGRNLATTTPPLPADDGRHAFFVPYHRLDLPAGDHEVHVTVKLQGPFRESPIPVLGPLPVRVRQPSSVWEYVSLEMPPGRPPFPTRVRLGKDVMVESATGSGLVVAAAQDTVSTDFRPGDRWLVADPANLRAAAMPGEAGPRLVRVRRTPPRIVEGAVSAGSEVRAGQPGVAVELRWTLEGLASEVMIELEPRVWSAGRDGGRQPLLGQVEQRIGDRARLWVPAWGVPAFVESGRAVRLGWDLVASGDGVSRPLTLPGLEREVLLSEPLRTPPVQAVANPAEIVAGDRGLTVVTTVRWSLPPGLTEPHPVGRADLSYRWADGTLGEPLHFPWTACVKPGDPLGCPEAWSVGPPTAPHGASQVRMPLGWLDPESSEGAVLVVESAIPGYRAARGRVDLGLTLPPTRQLEVRLRGLQVACPEGVSWSLALTPASGGLPRARSPETGCAAKKAAKADLRVAAFEGDTWALELVVAGKVALAVPIPATPGVKKLPFAAPDGPAPKGRLQVVVR